MSGGDAFPRSRVLFGGVRIGRREWQQCVDLWQPCHCRQDSTSHRFSAMDILFPILSILSVWAIGATVYDLRRDGYRRVPTHPSDVSAIDGWSRIER